MKQQTVNVKNEELEKKAYQKTLLYIYPHMKKMAAALETVVQTQAQLSYRSRENAETLVERLLDYGFQERFLLLTEQKIGLLLKEFTEEELYVLEYRYFRRKRILREYDERPVEMSLRTFYRRQHSVLKKFSAILKREGMDGQWFKENFSGMDWVMTVYRKVCAGKDSFLLGKFKNSPFFRNLILVEDKKPDASMPEKRAL